VVLQEVARQVEDVVAALAQRRHLDLDDAQAEEEVGAERAFSLTIWSSGRWVALTMRTLTAGRAGRRAAEALVLQQLQQLDLGGRVGLADLVEEQRAAFCGLHQAGLALAGIGEGALLVAEQLGLDQLRRQRAAVQLDEGHAHGAGPEVQRAGDQFLAGAGLAVDQHRRRVGVGELLLGLHQHRDDRSRRATMAGERPTILSSPLPSAWRWR
jgi:hypothetical protein